jgi:hypothetical protein
MSRYPPEVAISLDLRQGEGVNVVTLKKVRILPTPKKKAQGH